MSIPGTYSSMGRTSSGSIQYIGNSGRQVATNNLVMNANANTLTGDFVMIVAQYDQSLGISTPVGWTQAFEAVFSQWKCEAWYRQYSGTMPTLSFSSGSDHIIATTLTFRNVDSSTPLDIAVSSIEDPNEGDAEFIGDYLVWQLQGVTTASANAFVMWIVSHEAETSDSDLHNNWTNANITGGQELADYSTTNGFNGGFGIWGGIKTAAGATGNTSVGEKYFVNIGSSVVALRPS